MVQGGDPEGTGFGGSENKIKGEDIYPILSKYNNTKSPNIQTFLSVKLLLSNILVKSPFSLK